MLTKDLIAQVRKIEIRTRRIVDEITGGAYHSVFKGRGIEFSEVREYIPGDDVRDIDWNVTARMGHPYIKKFVEERELTVILAVDISASGLFGSADRTKAERATEIAALLAFSAIRNNDKVGLLLFSDKVELYLPPRSGRIHGLRLIRELVAAEPGGKTDINVALEHLMKVVNKRAVMFLLSDLICDNDYEKLLKIMNKRHDVISVRVLDPMELAWNIGGGIMVEDAESGGMCLFPGGGSERASYSDAATIMHEANAKVCKRAKVDMIDVRCGEDFVKPLVKFFDKRQKRA